ncbi:MAG TPA: adenine phosphoribosyltransferase [Anaerolineae bacterium]|nr:adenine phosphoribosyltransferase [Anaerolineae bacterium]
MSTRPTYPVEIAGIKRDLPLFEVAPGVTIAIFNILGDTLVTKAATAALADQLVGKSADIIVTAEAKSIPLAYELSALLGIPYVVLRKKYKSYMGDALKATSVSITTGVEQTLFLDEKDRTLIADKQVILLDDVISTGSTLTAMREIVTAASGRIAASAAVFTEGDKDWSDVIALGNLPVFID